MLIYPAFVVFAALLCLFVSARKKFRILALLGSAISLSVLAYLLLAEKPVLMGPEIPWYTDTPWKQVLSFGAMLCGMGAKYLWDLIEIRRNKNSKLATGEPRHTLEFDAWDFVQPLLVAGIVFSGVLAAQREMNLTGFLFSFQNGFFWQSVLKTKPQPQAA